LKKLLHVYGRVDKYIVYSLCGNGKNFIAGIRSRLSNWHGYIY